MLGPICKQLAGSKVILASGSPRRRQILENVVSQGEDKQTYLIKCCLPDCVHNSDHAKACMTCEEIQLIN